MAKGRKRLPDAVKKLRGTDQKCRMTNEKKGQLLSEDEIDASKVEGLATERAKDIYTLKCRQLAALGMLEETYQEAIILYASWLDIALTASVEIQKGYVRTLYDANGNVTGFVQNPYISILDKATQKVNDIGRQFGFTPVSRASIKVVEKELDPMAELAKLMQ